MYFYSPFGFIFLAICSINFIAIVSNLVAIFVTTIRAKASAIYDGRTILADAQFVGFTCYESIFILSIT